MHILFISPYVPSKIRVRPYNWIKHLVELGHQITLATLVSGSDDEAALPEMESMCRHVMTAQMPRWRPLWNCLSALPGSAPLQYAYSRSPALDQLLQQAKVETRFHVAHIEHLRGACFGPALSGLPVIFDAIDSISLLFERTIQAGPKLSSRLMARLDLTRTRTFEGQVLNRFLQVLVTSPEDAAFFTQLAPAKADTNRLNILPNGVDLDYFSPNGHTRQSNVLLFSGKMSYHPNVATALYLGREIMPRVWQERPDVELWIVGKGPAESVRALAADKRIKVTGFVPDIRPHLGQATISVSPLQYGAGIQNKILEAMACGLPVITNSQGCRALSIEPGRHLLISDEPEAFAQQALTLMQSPDYRATLSGEGRRYVETYHNWRSQTRCLVNIYQKVIEEHHTHGRE